MLEEGERRLAARLPPRMEAGMLVIADRGFLSFDLWAWLMATGADLLFRVSSHSKPPPSEVLPDGSYISEIKSKRVNGSLYRIPLSAVGDPREATHIPVRAVEYAIDGAVTAKDPEAYRVITTVLDHDELS
jgi:hypothetical protein